MIINIVCYNKLIVSKSKETLHTTTKIALLNKNKSHFMSCVKMCVWLSGWFSPIWIYMKCSIFIAGRSNTDAMISKVLVLCIGSNSFILCGFHYLFTVFYAWLKRCNIWIMFYNPSIYKSFQCVLLELADFSSIVNTFNNNIPKLIELVVNLSTIFILRQFNILVLELKSMQTGWLAD